MRKIFGIFTLVIFLINITFAGSYPFTEKDRKTIDIVSNKIESIIRKQGENKRESIIESLEKISKKFEKTNESKYWLIKDIISNIKEISVGSYTTPKGVIVDMFKIKTNYRYKYNGNISKFFNSQDEMKVYLDKIYSADNIVEEYKLGKNIYIIIKKESQYFYRDTSGDLKNTAFSTIDELKKYLKKQEELSKIDNSDQGSMETNSNLIKHEKDIEFKTVYYLKGSSKIALVGVDYTSFKEMKSNSDFGMDRNIVYYKGLKTKITDTPTFKVLKSGYIKDKNIVLYCNDTKCLEVPGADSQSFEVLSNGRGVDKNKQFNTINPIGD